MKTKTIVIWDDVDANIQFFIVDKDLTHLNRKYVNGEISEEIQDELLNLVYDEIGNTKVAMTTEFPYQAVKDGAVVIVMGFLP